MKPGDLYKTKLSFMNLETPHTVIKIGEILMFLKKETKTDMLGLHRRYFFLYKEKIISFSLGHDPVRVWVKKYT